MKSYSAIASLGLVAQASAFPAMAMDAMTEPLRALAQRQVAPPQGAGALPNTPPPFDAKAQRIDVSGKHAFVPPGPGDERGECPGLNAMANHGYLPHNGRATIQQFVDATNGVFGMNEDLSYFLAVYGAVIDGDGTSWSIGGKPHTGIAGSHGDYESDSSPLKSDLYQYGSLQRLIISQYKSLRDRQPAGEAGNYNLDVLRDFRKERFQESIDKNPKFAYQPFTGMAVSQAAYTFIYRFMANKTAEAPEGILTRDTLKSFMSITGTEEDPKWTFGHERIPENWYKRNQADEYSIPYFIADIGYFAEVEPRIIGIGCNHGSVDTYNEIDAATLSNGAYTAKQLAANPFCFASEFAMAELPTLTGLSLTNKLLAPLTNSLKQATSSLGCAAMPSVNMSALTACPGFTLYGGPRAPVAQGAIQS